METKHTPTPWKKLGEWAIISKTETIADLYQASACCDKLDRISANAEFIVRACNAHDDLVKALGTAIVMLEPYIAKDLSEPSRFFDCSPNSIALEHLKATYAKACGDA